MILHEKIVQDVPQLRRGQVWFRSCGPTEKVNSADCLRNGWPKHCGQTMTIDAPSGEAHEESVYDDVYTCKNHAACEARITAKEAK